MTGKWLNLFLRFSGIIFSLKQKIVEAKSWMRALPYVFLLLLAELVFIIVSLPLYLAVSPKKLQEKGMVFPSKEKEPAHIHVYIVRRKISLTTLFSAGGIFLLKFVFVGIVSAYLLGAQALLAATQDWNFNTAGDYTYNGAKIEVTSGVARLVDQGGGGSCTGTATACSTFVSSPTCAAQAGCAWNIGASGSTTNSGFNLGSTSWTYADWFQPTQTTAAGVYKSSGGNPGGYIDIGLSTTKKNKTMAGLWRQSFSTTVNSPSTITLNFDWKSLTYTAPSAPVTYKLYAFIDTGSGNPTLGQEVWTSGEITGTTSWTSVATINITNKLLTAGTYYLKIAAYVTTPNADKTYNFVSNFDNVQLNWSKAGACSGTAIACNTYSVSPTCSAQGGCSWAAVPVYSTSSPAIYPNISLSPIGVTSWNSFTETATKNGGAINYQLSSDDGVTWQYWNNSAWATAATTANSNSASVINTNIVTFPTTAGKIMWKAFLVSNGSQQIILDNIAIGYTQNAIPSVQNLSASQNTDSGYVNINYNLQDGNSDPISLANYEYSLTGAFTGEQMSMTAVPADPAHSGITGLSSSPSGIAHTFVWNARADLGDVYSSVYIRLRANDGIANSDFVLSPSITVDYINPVLTNVTAVQIDAGSEVQINYDLFDNTSNNILVELQVSLDEGSTWTVPATSVSGDIGSSVLSGNSKIITWQAGTDFANQEQNNMMVRVRAKDKYQNQGDYANSASFPLDNRAPVIVSQANLLAQPLAGATSVLVGGSFAESHPNTNEFYVAINGNAYGLGMSGDTNTATPSDLDVGVDTVLKGNDYISGVKIVHTDDFVHATNNENTSPNSAYKYVKPYTPPAPTIGSPGEDSLGVTINKHLSEASGLEYAIFEADQNKYVQSDGSLDSGVYWQAIGTVTVTGLSQPISQYSFKVKSRNISDSSYSASSESDLSSGASSDYQSPQIIINSTAQTTNGTKYVVIHYAGTDFRNQANNLTKYEYSLNGVDWQTMTERVGGASSGIAGLAFTSVGANLVFEWDVGLDLPNVEDTSVYVRLESNDAVTNSNIVVSPAFVVNTAGPIVSNIQAVQTLSTNNVVITYDLADGAGANNTVALLVSDDSGATYSVLAPSKTGDVGAGITAGLTRGIIWNVGADLLDHEKTSMRVKITATDSYGNEGSPVESSDFSIDTKAPIISNVSASQSSGSALVAVNYDLSDLSVSNVEFEVSSNSGSTWTIATTTYTGEMGAGQTAGTKLFNWNAVVDFPDQELDTMRIRARATDNFGHQGTYQESADFSVNTKMLSISDITAEQNAGANTVAIHYDLNKNATINLEISSDGGTTWDIATTTLTGNVNTLVVKGNNKTISWNAGVDFNNEEKTTMRVRLSGIDAFGVLSAYYESADFSVDTASPLGLFSVTKFAGTDTSATMNWSSDIADAHFNHYELWHGSNRTDVINRSGTAVKWSTADDANLSAITTISTVITGLNLTADYYVKIWAIDDYGNETTITDLNVFNTPVQKTLTLISSTGGTTNPAPGVHTFVADSILTITGIPDSGYAFSRWEESGLTFSTSSATNILLDFDRTISAFFEATTETSIETVVVSGGGGGGYRPDTIAPAKPVLSPISSPTNISSIKISGLAEVGSSVDLYDNGVLLQRLYNSADENGQFSETINFTEGEHVLTVKAVDSAINASEPSDAVNLKIKTTLPSAPIVLSPKSGDRITDETPALVGVAEPLAQIEITLDKVNKFTATADIDGAWQFNLPTDSALKDGAHSFVLIAIDQAGNKSKETVLDLNKALPVEVKTEEITNAPVSQPVAGQTTGQITVPVAVTSPVISAPLPTAELVRENVEAVELAGVPIPVVTNVNTAVSNDLFTFTGTALPNQDVIVYVHSDQALIYRAKADENGVWKINHSQSLVELAPGEHTIFAVAVDPNAKVKSQPSPVSTFTVSKNFWVSLFEKLNLQTTAISLTAILLTILWLYRIKKREMANT